MAGLLLTGGLLRFVTLGTQSYWFDEAQAAHELSLSFGQMLSSMVSHESNPPLYFTLGWAWARVFGTGAVGLRSLSALCGTAMIAIAYLCGRQLVSARAGLVAAALVAVSPFMIWYSQEAREYMLLAALCGVSLLYFARALERPSRGNVVGWAVFSALAILTHSFAGFLIAAEAVGLLYAVRKRRTVVAVAAVAAVQVALLPLILGHASSSLLGFITTTPLSMRIQQVPVAFGLGTLYQSSIVGYGLWGAWALAIALLALLLAGATGRQLRGAGIAAVLAAVVVLTPLLLALAGTDYYIFRALMPAWIPLAVVIGAACTAPRARIPGVALAALLLGTFIYAQVKIQSDVSYQRPDWRGVAAALGHPSGPRAIVVDDSLGTDPLMLYLPRVPWAQPAGPVNVNEVDVVGSPYQTPVQRLPHGIRLISRKTVDGFEVDRFGLAADWNLPLTAIGARAQQILPMGPASAPVLIQRAVS